MKRGTANEAAVLAALFKKDIFKAVFEVGMVVLKECDWLACSPDGIAALETSKLHFAPQFISS